MEMTYDGALVMPSAFNLLNQEQKRDIDGGWTGYMSNNTIAGLFSCLGYAYWLSPALTIKAGIAISSVIGAIKAGVTWIAAKIGSFFGIGYGTVVGAILGAAISGWGATTIASALMYGKGVKLTVSAWPPRLSLGTY